jgi:hypothetical protein
MSARGKMGVGELWPPLDARAEVFLTRLREARPLQDGRELAPGQVWAAISPMSEDEYQSEIVAVGRGSIYAIDGDSGTLVVFRGASHFFQSHSRPVLADKKDREHEDQAARSARLIRESLHWSLSSCDLSVRAVDILRGAGASHDLLRRAQESVAEITALHYEAMDVAPRPAPMEAP